MTRPPLGRHAAHWGLWVGGIFLPLAPLAGAAAAPALPGVAVAQAEPVAPMLAQNWHHGLDPAAYLVSEKLDGVRALWDGQVLRFKSGRPIAAPAWFTAALPQMPLDGELWLGRGGFDRLSGIVRRGAPQEALWREVRYMVFDLPGLAGPFEARAAHMVATVARPDAPWLQAVAQLRVADRAALARHLRATVDAGGEGLVLHRADALWQSGRSDALRKLKPVLDEEARVLAHLPGKGRHAGRLGALLLERPNGQRFALGTGFTDAQRMEPPPVGSWVTYRYRDRTASGVPKFASFLRTREAE